MSTNYHYGDKVGGDKFGGDKFGGDKVSVRGNHNVGMIKNQETADPREALQEMINVVQVMRGQISAGDRQVIDESMTIVHRADNVEKGTLRRALSNIAGVAAMVGQVGVPVLESIRTVMAAFGV
jgi:hypothetical protein